MEYLKVWTSFRQVISPLSDAEKGRLFDAMLLYAETGEEPSEFAGNERFLWQAAKQDIDRTAERCNTLRANASKGGLAKSRNKQELANVSNDKQELANVSCKEKKSKEKKSNVIKTTVWFDRFWDAYPRHVNKQAAMKAFDKAQIDGTLLDKILTAIARQKESAQWQKDNGQFIPHPATWLNGKRWEDETTPVGAMKTVVAQQYEQRDYSGEQDEAMQRMLKLVNGA